MRAVRALLKNTDAPWSLHPQESVFDALHTLASHDVGALMVMEEGRLVGILSERDYTRKVALQGKNSKEITVADIMTRNVITVTPGTGSLACMTLMSQNKIRHLPVVDGPKVLGMISIRDLMNDIIAEHEQTISQLTNYIKT